MGHLEKLLQRAKHLIADAINEFNSVSSVNKSFVLGALHDTKVELDKVDLETYYLQLAAKIPTETVFEEPLRHALEILNYKPPGRVENDLKFLGRMAPNDPMVLIAITRSRRKSAQASYCLRLMLNRIERFARSAWIPLIFLGGAVIFAASYYVLVASRAGPLEPTLASLSVHANQISNSVANGRNPIKSVTAFLADIKSLFTTIPPLLTAVAAAILAIQRLFKYRS